MPRPVTCIADLYTTSQPDAPPLFCSFVVNVVIAAQMAVTVNYVVLDLDIPKSDRSNICGTGKDLVYLTLWGRVRVCATYLGDCYQ